MMKALAIPHPLACVLLPAIALMVAACGTPASLPAGTGSALQAHVWQCSDGSTVYSRNMASPPGITLRTGSETRTLPQVPAASGTRYQDPMMQFRTKGDSATLERQQGVVIDCREIRSQSLLEDARVRGVSFRGTGNEPGWLLEIGPDRRIMFEDGYGSMRVVFESPSTAKGTEPGMTVHEGSAGNHRIRITLRRQTCSDTMSEQVFPYSVDVEMDGIRRRGCGTALQ